MQLGFRHYHSSYFTQKKRVAKKWIDTSIYIFGTLGVIILLPQLWTVWSQSNTSGVSLLSWVGMAAGSGFWLVYGILYGVKPIMYVNALALTVQSLVVAGLLLH